MESTARKKHETYTAHQRSDESIRETEARALLSCANRLENARRPDCPREEFVAAVRHNQQLWTLFQSCLCEPDNPLPDDLKIILLNISRYVDKASFRAIGDGDAGVLPGLISINRNIAAGLSAKPKQEKAEKTSDELPIHSSVVTTA